MKKYNWAVFKDNKPKYKKGDLVLYNYPRLVGIIESVEKEILTDDVKKEISESVSRQRNCCGKPGRGVIHRNFYYTYKLNGAMIEENEIVGVGIESINEHLREQDKQYDDLSEKIEQAASTLGYNY